MATYEKTHPWIRFGLNMSGAKPTVWMLLGEAASKCEHIAGVPLQPGTAERLHQLYLAKGAAATTAIEGNTLTEDEVLKRIEGRLELPPTVLSREPFVAIELAQATYGTPERVSSRWMPPTAAPCGVTFQPFRDFWIQPSSEST